MAGGRLGPAGAEVHAQHACAQEVHRAAAAIVAGLLVVSAGALWTYYGTAVFYEIILAGLNACF